MHSNSLQAISSLHQSTKSDYQSKSGSYYKDNTKSDNSEPEKNQEDAVSKSDESQDQDCEMNSTADETENVEID